MTNIVEYFDTVSKNFEYVFNKYFLNKDNLNLLQIGAYSGRSSEWMLNKINNTCILTDVDTWLGSGSQDGHLDNHQKDFSPIENLHNSRTSGFSNFIKFKGTSDEYFEAILDSEIMFDFVYVDGSHKHDDVYNDAVNSYKHLKKGGIIAFDDYFWNIEENKSLIPHFAIKKFISEHDFKILIDENSSYSVWKQLWAIKI